MSRHYLPSRAWIGVGNEWKLHLMSISFFFWLKNCDMLRKRNLAKICWIKDQLIRPDQNMSNTSVFSVEKEKPNKNSEKDINPHCAIEDCRDAIPNQQTKIYSLQQGFWPSTVPGLKPLLLAISCSPFSQWRKSRRSQGQL